ncbi:TPA: hypothetical protein N0F65_000694 [Lagenidium giganteum]|uniref:Transposase n=1 Tax=Lagenidium giganteum TaxID=4803 RepID=A0AAV2YU06_9STRA|nr:TPA: hypothetical protein N0F65_000694 [Lagenidium giganteum]
MYDVIHIDEKWFYMKRAGQKLYVVRDKDSKEAEKASYQFVKYKRHIMKVMCCTSSRKLRGVAVTTPCNKVTRVVSRRMMINHVIPTVKEVWPTQLDMAITVQQDNAFPHVRANDEAALSCVREGGWRIRLRNQPAQSPNLNVLDLGFFASFQSIQNQSSPQTTSELIDVVKIALHNTSATTLNKTFITLQLCIEEVYRDQEPTTSNHHGCAPHDIQTMVSCQYLWNAMVMRFAPRPIFCTAACQETTMIM